MSIPATGAVIDIRDISKRFWLRGHGMNPLRRVARRLLREATTREHWALRDVNLQISAGETVALMGVNGSGKSTLLKVISQVMNPTSGEVRVAGKVGGIIDLGAGFHGDLTGFENIFLHGTLLGLSRQTIRARLKQIEDFCELGKFLNTPVRHYSWGMFLRLGFAIAVHTDPEVFVVDEALAVGDGYFQWKCMRKIEELQKAGRTILFVSHVPEVAESLCRRAVWLHEGRVRADGPSSEVVQQYNEYLFQDILANDPRNDSAELAPMIRYNRFGTGDAVIRNVRFVSSDGVARRYFRSGEPMEVRFDILAHRRIDQAAIYLVVNRPVQPVSFFDSADRQVKLTLEEGMHSIALRIPDVRLRAGTYYATVAISEAGRHADLFDCHQKMYAFNVVPGVGEPANEFSSRVVDLRPEVRVVAG